MDTQSSSFGFLASHGPLYLRLATAAERTLAIDPSLTLVSLRQLAEAFAREAGARVGLIEGTRDAGANQLELLRGLESRGVVRDHIAELFHQLRKQGNRAAHDFVGSHQDALHALHFAYRLATWFHRTFGKVPNGWAPPAYVPPPDPTATLRALREEAAKARAESDAHRSDADKARALHAAVVAGRAEEAALRQQVEAERAEWEGLAHAYEAELQQAQATQAALVAAAAAQAAQAPAAQTQQVVAAAVAATHATELDEHETRLLVDAQLRDAGWEADTDTLRWKAGARPEAGKHRAIAEVPTWTQEDGKGFADYVLFIGLEPYAIVEAKKRARHIPSSLDQAARYARGLVLPPPPPSPLLQAAEAMASPIALAAAKPGPVPFLYATNGRPYLKQLESASGIWFRDARDPTNLPRALTGWHSPEELVYRRTHDPAAAQARLAAEPPETVREALHLRPYQVRALEAVEAALGRGQRALLVAMATGTGKTRTVIALVHRLLRTQRFRRILFLVDRSALGTQAHDAFADTRLENLQTFAQNYNVLGLDDTTPARETQVHVATVQGLVKRLLWPAPDEPPVPIDRYDCIIVDESHRGYTLDREMSEGEQELRGFEDYVSTYRRVLDHFDAVKIGLTATPAAHTREIFGDPVFYYRYPEAVVDGWLVDHEPPIRITTQLARTGIHFDAGAEVVHLLPGGQTQLSLLPDELDFDVAAFNREVVTEGWNRAVAAELADHLDPFGEAKTIVFCVDDAHAELFVPILKEALARHGPIDNDTVQKLTGRTDRVDGAIRRFKNERLPQIAVTVDLLSTGIDVPRVANIVFLRRIKSRILYEQMLGRATRLCPEIGKETFRVFDAVGLYEILSQVSDMKPLVKDASVRPRVLLDELVDPRAATLPGRGPGRTHADDVLDDLVERLRRLVRRLGRRAPGADTASTLDSLESLFGCALAAIPDTLHAAGTAGAIALLRARPEAAVLIERLADTPGPGTPAIIAPHADQVVDVARGYGDGRTRPDDYLSAFAAFVAANRNLIPALAVVCTRPRDLTRAQLKELKLKLDAAGYSETHLRTAYREKNQDIAATIIGFIRQRALGSPLVPYAERVDRAVARVLSTGTWTPPQRKWLERIAKQLKEEVILDEDAFTRGAFVNAGGWKGVDQALGGRLKQVLDDLGDEVWNDGKVA